MSPRLLIKTRLGVTRPRLAYFGIPRPRTESCAGEHWDPRCRVADCVPVVGRKTGSRPRHFSVYQAGGVRDFQYCTIDSWSRTRRVVGEAQRTLEGANPRFIVTSLRRSRVAYDKRKSRSSAGAPSAVSCRGPRRLTILRKQPLPGLRILNVDSADRTVLCRLQDLRLAVATRVDRLRLAAIVQPEHSRCDRLAHRIPDACVRIHPNFQLPRHDRSPNAR
jgi:hypothetical protein